MNNRERLNYDLNLRYLFDRTYLRNLHTDNDPGYTVSQGVAERDSGYTNLLKNYVSLTKGRNILKEVHKWIFFWIIIVGTVVIGAFLIGFVNTQVSSMEQNGSFNSDAIAALISALVSLVTVVISIPIIITKYLFNTKEDENITAIIKETQEHDSKEITLLDDYFKIGGSKKSQKKQPKNVNDTGKKNTDTSEAKLEVKKALSDI